MPAPDQPLIRPVDPYLYELVEDYHYEWEKDGTHYAIIVPRGFVFDYASVPRPLWAFIGPFDLGPAALVHDWIYANGGDLSGAWPPPPSDPARLNPYAGLFGPILASYFVMGPNEWIPAGDRWSRRAADRLFGRMMRESGVARWRRRTAYLAVRLFGGFAWSK